MLKRNYPGRLTREQWRALPPAERRTAAKRAQCDLLELWRDCANKRCRRARCCVGDPHACERRHLPRVPPRRQQRTRDARAALDILPYS